MALVFLGKVGFEHTVEELEDGSKVDGKKQAQQFIGGTIVVTEQYPDTIRETVAATDHKGDPLLDDGGRPLSITRDIRVMRKVQHFFKVPDIGKPYDKFIDEDDVLKRYPEIFRRP